MSDFGDETRGESGSGASSEPIGQDGTPSSGALRGDVAGEPPPPPATEVGARSSGDDATQDFKAEAAEQLPSTARGRAEADALAEQRAEAEAFTIGPGVAGTKSQMRGGIGGIVLGIVIGAVLGWIIGAILGGTALTVITIIVGAVAGAVAGGVIGGFLHPREKLQGGEADI